MFKTVGFWGRCQWVGGDVQKQPKKVTRPIIRSLQPETQKCFFPYWELPVSKEATFM